MNRKILLITGLIVSGLAVGNTSMAKQIEGFNRKTVQNYLKSQKVQTPGKLSSKLIKNDIKHKKTGIKPKKAIKVLFSKDSVSKIQKSTGNIVSKGLSDIYKKPRSIPNTLELSLLSKKQKALISNNNQIDITNQKRISGSSNDFHKRASANSLYSPNTEKHLVKSFFHPLKNPKPPFAPFDPSPKSTGGLVDTVLKLPFHFKVYDYAAIDGDRVSIMVLNQNAIHFGVADYEMSGERYAKVFKVKNLKAGPVELRLTALNEGEYKPNTGAIKILSPVEKASTHLQRFRLKTGETGVMRVKAVNSIKEFEPQPLPDTGFPPQKNNPVNTSP